MESRVAKLLELTEKTSGRDKLCRLVQYGSKFVYWLMELNAVDPALVAMLKQVESSISTARKLFRLGTSFSQFWTVLQTIQLGDPLLRFLVTLTKINRGIYLLIDHLIWAHRMGLMRIHEKYWSRFSNQFWLLAIFLGLVRDVYELLRALRIERERLRQYQNYQSVTTQALGNTVKNNPAVCLDVVKNCSDLFIPLTRLDHVYLPGGIVGLLGVASSFAGLVATYNRHLKLKFS